MGLLDKLKKTKGKDEAVEKQADLKDVNPPKVDQPSVEKDKKKKEEVKKPTIASSDVLVKPLVSEKAARGEANGAYTFVVKNKASKIEIKKAVKSLYGVLPVQVRIMNFEGKRKRFGRVRGKRIDWKKAVVTLPKGKNIDIHTGV